MSSLMVVLPWLTLAGINGCGGDEKKVQDVDSAVDVKSVDDAELAETEVNLGKIERLGDYQKLAGSFPISIDLVVSSYGIEMMARTLQRAWRIADKNDSLKHIQEPLTQLTSKNPMKLGFDLTQPILAGIGFNKGNEVILFRFPVTDAESAEKALSSTLKELEASSGNYALQQKDSALWLALGNKGVEGSLTQMLNESKLSSSANFSKLAAKVPQGADFSYQMSASAYQKLQAYDRDFKQLSKMNIDPDSVAYSYTSGGKSYIKSHHGFSNDSFVSDIKQSSASSDFLSHLPHDVSLAFSSHLDIPSLFELIRGGRLGTEAQEAFEEIDEQKPIKAIVDEFANGYEGPIVATMAVGPRKSMAMVPVIGIKSSDPVRYKNMLIKQCNEMGARFIESNDGVSFCSYGNFAIGVWKSHLVLTHPSFVSNLGKTPSKDNLKMTQALSEKTLMTAAVDFESLAEALPQMPGFKRDFKGFPSMLTLATTIEMAREHVPNIMSASIKLNGNYVDTELSMDAAGGQLSAGLPMVGILAAIAIPNFISMQYKTKRAEVPMNMRSIKTALIAYESEYDVYVNCAAYPSTPTKTAQIWSSWGSGGFKTLGWQPDGMVRGSYSVSTTATNFVITGLTDVDGDGTYATYTATKSENPSLITAPDVY